MSTKEPPNGLFSKVAKFVRNPTTNWADLERPEAEQEPGYSKQALKEMIERKRQNDFVRKREFDQLRKLRSRGPGGASPDMARPSYFQNSLPANSDERAMTIKKIDEIEAQMSNQWWQGKQQGRQAPSAAAAMPAPAPAAPSSLAAGESALADAKAYAPTRLSPMLEETLPPDTVDFPPTRPNSTFGKNAATTVPGPSKIQMPSGAEQAPGPPPAARAKPPPPAPAFAHSQTFAVELVAGVSDPDLEEAAIRFANGDNQGAEQGLLAALAGASIRQEQADGWNAALFDLYRATGQQKRFDSVAITYAERYGRSAPAWFSIPERLGNSDATVERTRPTVLTEDPTWRSPALLDRAALDTMQRSMANPGAVWHLDWTALRQVAPEAVTPLAALFADWCDTLLQLRFTGADQLAQVLRGATPAGDRSVDADLWRLRMDALRLMRLQDAFELVALEYCLTFEVSPPAWQDPRCGVHSEPSPLGDVSVVDELPLGSGTQPLSGASAADAAPTAPTVELSGEILGEAADALDKLEAARQGADRMVISCANLVRVDFSAAGSLLNWVATREAEGCHLQFREVHRLVAAFFHVIGIHEHARVVVRTT